MLKIDLVEALSRTTTLRLEGRLIGPWVEELARACEQAIADRGRLTLDLSRVSFVDREGVRLLQSLGARDVQILDAPPFVAEQLRAWRVRL